MTNDELYQWHHEIIEKLRALNPLDDDEINHIAFCFGAVWMLHGERDKKKNEGGR